MRIGETRRKTAPTSRLLLFQRRLPDVAARFLHVEEQLFRCERDSRGRIRRRDHRPRAVQRRHRQPLAVVGVHGIGSRMLFRRLKSPHAPLIASIGLENGDRVAHIGCPDPARLVAISSCVGTGNVVAIVPDRESAERARAAASANSPRPSEPHTTMCGATSGALQSVRA